MEVGIFETQDDPDFAYRLTCSAIRRRGFKFEHIITCNPEDAEFAYKTEIFTHACNAIARFKGARLLWLYGVPYEGWPCDLCPDGQL